MNQTISEKILSRHAGKPVKAGDIAVVRVDGVMATDATAPFAIKAFRQMGGKKLWDVERVSLIIDHFGVLGIPRQPVNWVKIVGVCFLLLGTVCISRSKAIESMLSSRGDSPYNAPENSGRTP